MVKQTSMKMGDGLTSIKCDSCEVSQNMQKHIEIFGSRADYLIDGKLYRAEEFFREGRRGIRLVEAEN